MEESRETCDVLHIRLRPADAHVKLAELKDISNRLQQTLNAIARSRRETEEVEISYEIVHAAVGSLSLALRAVGPPGSDVAPEVVFSTFAEDLVNIRERTYRSDLTPGLVSQYLSLVRTLGDSQTAVEYRCGDRRISVDKAFRTGFEVALRETVAEDVSVVGTLEAVNAHRKPFAFYLYPKLPQSDRVECRFAEEMLDTVAELLKGRSIVMVTGRGHFLPIGIYPVRIDVSEVPRAMVFDAGKLRSYVRSLALVPTGMTTEQYLQQKREAAGLAE